VVISHPAAAFCIQLPMLERTVAAQSTVKIVWRNGLHAEPPTSAVVESDVCIRIARFMNAWQLDLEAERE
jgi:hypothetical protein